MPILAGERLTAAKLNRLQPTTYDAIASSALTGPQTNTDVPGATITLSTETDNAIAVVDTTYDFDPTGAVSGLSSGRLWVDGVAVGLFAVFQAGPGVSGDRGTHSQSYRVSLGTAGSHTLKLVTTLATGVNLNLYTGLVATIHEVV